MLEIFLLVAALCVDQFVASIAYESEKIKIAFKEMIILNLISSSMLGAALLAGSLLNSMVPAHLTKGVGVSCLFVLAVVRLLDYSIKQFINRHQGMKKNIQFTFSKLRFIISIYGDPVSADADHSKALSAKEAVFLAVAMSLDSLVAGTLAGFLAVNLSLTIAAAFVIGMLSMYGGQLLGRKIARHSTKDLSWMSGVLFLILALTKL